MANRKKRYMSKTTRKILSIIAWCLFCLALLALAALLLIYFVPAIAMLLPVVAIEVIKMAGWVSVGLCVTSLMQKCAIQPCRAQSAFTWMTYLLYAFGEGLCSHFYELEPNETIVSDSSSIIIEAKDEIINKTDKILDSIACCVLGLAMLLVLAALLVSFVSSIAMLLPIATIGVIKVAGWVSAGLCMTSIMSQCTVNDSNNPGSAFSWMTYLLYEFGRGLCSHFNTFRRVYLGSGFLSTDIIDIISRTAEPDKSTIASNEEAVEWDQKLRQIKSERERDTIKPARRGRRWSFDTS
jgi:hypothetical protein